MRTVFVGTDPGRGSVPFGPGSGSTSRLAELCGVGVEEFLDRFDRINLACREGGGSDLAGARNLGPILRGRRVVAVGARVSEALGVSGLFEWRLGLDRVAASIPHPSGLSRWWNDPENRAIAQDFLSRVSLPCIHVEGPDGSGKSRLVPWLSRRLGLREMPTEGPPGSWGECLGRISMRIAPGVVCDRSSGLVSELVYGPVLRGKTVVDEDRIWGVVRAVVGSVVFVYCKTDRAIHRVKEGEDPRHVEAVGRRSVELRERYDEVMSKISAEGGMVLRYDWRRDSMENLMRAIGGKRCVE